MHRNLRLQTFFCRLTPTLVPEAMCSGCTPSCAPFCEHSGHISTPPISQKTTHCYNSIAPYFTFYRLGCKCYFTFSRLGLDTNICEQKFTIRTGAGQVIKNSCKGTTKN